MKRVILYIILFLLSYTLFAQTQVRVVGRTIEGENKFILTDNFGETVSMDYGHWQIHRSAHYFVTGATTMASGDTIVLQLVAPLDSTGKSSFATFEIHGSAILEVKIYENNLDSGLVEIQTFNNNRNSSDTALTKIYAGCDSTNCGTLIYHYKGGSSQGNARAGGGTRNETEIVLKKDTKYQALLISGSADNLVSYYIRFCEEIF